LLLLLLLQLIIDGDYCRNRLQRQERMPCFDDADSSLVIGCCCCAT